jgi:hypothetical protein
VIPHPPPLSPRLVYPWPIPSLEWPISIDLILIILNVLLYFTSGAVLAV